DPKELSAADSEGRDNSGAARANVSGAAPLTLDLRGYREEDARLELDRFLDQAVYQGLREAEVIHGRGSGNPRSCSCTILRRIPE
ncbi:Smr/MutS family protein, partial [Escherichia coli]|uniref:Smr/MutS family protein n=1 Tax=Escherichia coli TaxID=562 RepID=UPI0015C468D6